MNGATETPAPKAASTSTPRSVARLRGLTGAESPDAEEAMVMMTRWGGRCHHRRRRTVPVGYGMIVVLGLVID